MKTKIVSALVMTLLIGTIISVVNSASACTGFTAKEGEKVLVGANLDWSQSFDMYMHFFPAEPLIEPFLHFFYCNLDF